MSLIGKQAISIPEGVTVNLTPAQVTVIGPQAELKLRLPAQIKVELIANQLKVSTLSHNLQTQADHGSVRAHLNNMVCGVVTPWKKDLEIYGTGYKASLEDNRLKILVGYIHPVYFTAPPGIEFQVTEETKITVLGADKTLVGQIASNIRKTRKPEPYKGKGIRYAGERIKLKAGKTAKT